MNLSGCRWRVAALAAAMMLVPAVAQASPNLTATMTMATPATVGQTLPGSVVLTNGSTSEDPSLTICNAGDGGACAGSDGIVLIPSCGQDAGTTCVLAGADPGVFSINQPATGGAGTRCANMTFLTPSLGGPFGKIRFAPTGGIDITLSLGETCRIDFTFTVLKLPTIDARPQSGAQTVGIVGVGARSYLNAGVSAGASSVLTVVPAPPAAPSLTGTDPASPANDNTPEIKGTAAAQTTVTLYTNSSCTSSPAAQGAAAAFTSPGLTATVADNSTTTFYATATDPSTGLVSACSTSSRTYVEDSTLTGPSGAGVGTSSNPAAGPSNAGTTAQVSELTGCPLKGNTVTGTAGKDSLRGTAKTDIIAGLLSSDVLRGLGGRDCLFGGDGSDRLFGGSGADLLFGGPDSDNLSGDAGNDRLRGDAGIDRIDGGAGNDELLGGSGNDRLVDRRGTDRVTGGAGTDDIDTRDSSTIGRRGRDRISCGPGRDSVRADPRDIVSRDCETVRKRSL